MRTSAATPVDPLKHAEELRQIRFDFAQDQWLFLRCAFALL